MDWKQIVASVAPGLATALGGPLAGGVVSVLADKLLGGSTGDPVADEAKLAGVLSGGLTPELRAQVLAAEQALKLAVVQAGLEQRRIDADLDKATLADVADARRVGGANRDLFILGAIILCAWALLTAGTLWGLFAVLTGKITLDIAIVATVFTVVGSVVGYISNIAQQVVSFWFGSSRGSTQKTEAMASAITAAGGSVRP